MLRVDPLGLQSAQPRTDAWFDALRDGNQDNGSLGNAMSMDAIEGLYRGWVGVGKKSVCVTVCVADAAVGVSWESLIQNLAQEAVGAVIERALKACATKQAERAIPYVGPISITISVVQAGHCSLQCF